MSNDTLSESPIEQLFSQSVTQGSARYWAAHFTAGPAQSAVKAVFCFAHAMDLLTHVSPDVIAEKSVWWHEELTDTTPASARHPVTQTLLNYAQETWPDKFDDISTIMTHAMHRHLHGALMSQQQTVLDSSEAWHQYLELRLGTLHKLIALASGAPAELASTLGVWASELHSASILRVKPLHQDARWLTPPDSLNASDTAEPPPVLKLADSQPPASAANQVLIDLELRWWKRHPDEASPVFTGLPVGLRGMLAAWRAARRSHSYLN